MDTKKLVKRVENFLTEGEINVLNDWTSNHYNKPYFVNPGMNNDSEQTRFTTRHAYGRCEEYQEYQVEYPKEVYDIQKRLIKYLKLNQNSIAPWPFFTNGICTTIAFSPGSCVEHTDPVYYQNTYTLHCNFVTQNPKSGGITYLESVPYEFKESDILMYITSHVQHGVTEISGDIPRILWVYGFCVSFTEMNNIFGIPTFQYQ
tara:strand:- start:8 stop:616 length:609 start_codon:yes stop_codon:yes gene_type:complete